MSENTLQVWWLNKITNGDLWQEKIKFVLRKKLNKENGIGLDIPYEKAEPTSLDNPFNVHHKGRGKVEDQD